jgi:hypothetical protein
LGATGLLWRLDDFDDQLDDAGRRIEHSAFLPLLHGEGTEQVFVNLPEGIALQIDWAEKSQKFDEDRIV